MRFKQLFINTVLTALASYQVDEGAIHAFRSQYQRDDKLTGAAAWASFTAARRIGSWLSHALALPPLYV